MTAPRLMEMVFGPFGEPIRMTGSQAASNPFRFSTKYDDDESDLAYYGYRYYKPMAGTWECRDPLEEDSGEPLYVTARNDVINHVDAHGRITVKQGPEKLTYNSTGCGLYDVDFTFTCTAISPPEGYLIQEVNVTPTILSCSRSDSGNLPKTADHYYEILGFLVPAGINYTIDHSSLINFPGTVGIVSATGKVKYFFDDTTGDLYDNPNWKYTKGRSWYTEQMPKWWPYPSDNGEGTAYRGVFDTWSCGSGVQSQITVAIPAT